MFLEPLERHPARVIAAIGLPAGVTVAPQVLKSLEAAGAFDAWEVRDREVVLYWRGLAPSESKPVVLDAVAAIPGTVTAPASRAALYYAPESTCWTAGVALEVTPAK